jgi:hypothetical protein
MPRYLLHGLVVETRTELDADPAPLLLGRLPEAPDGVAADVVVVTRPGAPAMDGPGLRVTAAEPAVIAPIPPEPAALLVTSPGVAITVTGSRLDAVLDPAVARDDAYAFAQVPLLAALLAALRPRGLYHLHAAALVAPGGRSLLVAGAAGSGKSTLGAALVLAGCDYLGDDIVLVRDGPELVSFPREFHLAARSADAIPGAARALEDGRFTLSGKHRVDPRALFPGRERDRAAAPAALLFPTVTRASTTALEPVAPAHALGLLLESSAMLTAPALPGGRAHLAALAAIADGATAFAVALGADLLADARGTAARILAEALA